MSVASLVKEVKDLEELLPDMYDIRDLYLETLYKYIGFMSALDQAGSEYPLSKLCDLQEIKADLGSDLSKLSEIDYNRFIIVSDMVDGLEDILV